MKTKKVNWTVKGKGDSLWGDSKGTFKVQKVELWKSDWDPTWGEVRAYGSNTDWVHYTDSQIENEMEVLIKKSFPKVKSLTWSEQGMQPDGGWSFDVDMED